MSRGLGKRQLEMLAALASLDAGAADHHFPVSLVLARLFVLSADMQERVNAVERERRAWEAERRAAADAGDDVARQLVHLTPLLRDALAQPYSRGRKRERRQAGASPYSEAINPSRVLAALERRGLVSNSGRGWYRITPAGRDKCRNNLPTV
jgi:hypothetical protein